MSDLDHEGITKLKRQGEEKLVLRRFKNYTIMAMELVEGGNLEDFIRNRKNAEDPLTEEECANITK